jgi:hypothetical protein
MNSLPHESIRLEMNSFMPRFMSPFFMFVAGASMLCAIDAWNRHDTALALSNSAFTLVIFGGAIWQISASNACNRRGLAKLQAGDASGAVVDFERALKIESANAAANNRATANLVWRKQKPSTG